MPACYTPAVNPNQQEAPSLPAASGKHNGSTAAEPNDAIRRPRVWLVLLIAYSCVMHFAYLGSITLKSHEAFLAERTQEMIRRGHWIVPHLNGQADVQKPPLPFWVLGAVSLGGRHINDWTARIPSTAFSIGTMLLVVALMWRMRGPRAGLISGFVFTTSYTARWWGRKAEVESQTMFWSALMLTAYWFGLRSEARRRRIAWFAVMWASLGLGVLAKGPFVPMALAAAVIVMAAFTRPGRRIGKMLPVAGPVIAAAVAAPWFVWMLATRPDAMDVWLSHSAGRVTGEEYGHSPVWYYFVQAPQLWAPWPIAVAFGVWAALRRKLIDRDAAVFLLGWGFGGLLLLSAVSTKSTRYALVMAPPVFALAGLGLDWLLFRAPRRLPRWGWGLWAAHLPAIPGMAVGAILAADKLPAYRWHLIGAGMLGAAMFLAVLALYARGRRAAALLTFGGGVLVAFVWAVGQVAVPVMNRANESAWAGKYVARHVPDETAVALYKKTPIDGTAVFYAGRTLPLIEGLDELIAWRRENPRGYVLVKDDHSQFWMDEVRIAGEWRAIDYHPDPLEDHRRYHLMRAVPPKQPTTAP